MTDDADDEFDMAAPIGPMLADEAAAWLREVEAARGDCDPSAAVRAGYRVEVALRGVVAEHAARVAAEAEADGLRRDLAAVGKARDEAVQRAEWFRAAHMLIAQEHLIAPVRDGKSPFVYNSADAAVVDGGVPALYVIVNDTFAYASADAERADYADAPELLRLAATEGWPGLVRWVVARRHEKGDPCDPILPVGESMKTMDAVRAERDLYRAALADAARGRAFLCEDCEGESLATQLDDNGNPLCDAHAATETIVDRRDVEHAAAIRGALRATEGER